VVSRAGFLQNGADVAERFNCFGGFVQKNTPYSLLFNTEKFFMNFSQKH